MTYKEVLNITRQRRHNVIHNPRKALNIILGHKLDKLSVSKEVKTLVDRIEFTLDIRFKGNTRDELKDFIKDNLQKTKDVLNKRKKRYKKGGKK